MKKAMDEKRQEVPKLEIECGTLGHGRSRIAPLFCWFRCVYDFRDRSCVGAMIRFRAGPNSVARAGYKWLRS